VEVLDRPLDGYADALVAAAGRRERDSPGAGAAGGTCGGLVGVLGAEPSGGALLVAEAVGLPAALAGADLVITGEGRVDGQSAGGKVVSAVAALAQAHGVPCVALAGGVAGPLDELHALGLTAAFSLADGPRTLDELKADAARLLTAAAEQAIRLFAR
jgi:glycerate kinase